MTSLPLPENIDWDALMRDMAPPEWDLLLSAAAQNDLPKMRELVEGPLQVPVLHTNGVGQSALHIAALWGHAPIVQYLLAHGADVNAVNSIQGFTPLHSALSSSKLTPDQQWQIALLLLNHSNDNNDDNNSPCDPHIRDKYNKVPFDYVPQDHPHRSLMMAKGLEPPPLDVPQLRTMFVLDATRGMPGCRPAT